MSKQLAYKIHILLTQPFLSDIDEEVFNVYSKPFFKPAQNKVHKLVVVSLLGDSAAYQGERIVQYSHEHVQQNERDKHGEREEINGTQDPVSHAQRVVVVLPEGEHEQRF